MTRQDDLRETVERAEEGIAEKNLEIVEKYPLLVRIYGALSIIAGGVQVLSVALAAVLLGVSIASGELDLSQFEQHTATTLVISIVTLVLSVVLAVMFVILGVRLLRGRRRRAALIANVMILLEVLLVICQFMLSGLSYELIPLVVNLVILIALQSYSDPALAEERQLQRKLQKMETRTEVEEGTLGRDTTGKGYIKLNFFNIFWIFVVCCVIGLVIGGAFEFFVSWFLETAFGIVAWDYAGTFLNIDGRTNFMFMCIWGLLGLVWVKFAMPVMLKIVNLIPWNWRYAVTSVCALLMAVDCVLTLAAFDCWFQREGGTMDYEHPSAIVAFCNEHYDNSFMANRFQSMTINPDDASRVK